MEKWEVRYLHELAVIESFYEMHDKILPKQKYGTISYDKNITRTFHGKKFFAALNKRNHTSAAFENCECHNHVKN